MAETLISYYGITIGFDEPYYSGVGGVPAGIGSQYHISIGGHPYLAETSFTPFKQDAYKSQSIQAIADKSDINNIPGESSINSQGLWRRGMRDFSSGAGQQFLDHEGQGGSISSRYLQSHGIDPWTQWQASLLPATKQVHGTGTEVQVLTAGGRVYINDNGTVRWSSDLVTWTPVTGTATVAVTNCSIATDGYNVYIASGANGIYLSNVTISTAASFITSSSAAPVNSVWYAGGQLICAGPSAATSGFGNNALYSITTATSTTAALPTALFAHPNTHYSFTTCASGNSWVYVGGNTNNSGANQGFVYKTQMNSTGTALIVPIVASSLPGGELVYSLYAYANFILLGTNLGARFCETLGINDPGGNAGDLKVGPVVPDQIQQVARPVRCFTGQFRFVWFGWSNQTFIAPIVQPSQYTGLGRMDLSTFIDQQAPAYTADLTVVGNGEVISMDWYGGTGSVSMPNFNGPGAPIFIVAGLGVYTAASTYVSSGFIDSGYLTYGLASDKKVALYMAYDVKGTGGSIGSLVTVDDAAQYVVPTQNLTNQLPPQQQVGQATGLKFDVLVTLSSDTATNTLTPILHNFTMKALPAVVSGTTHLVVINLWTSGETPNGPDVAFDAYAEWKYLDSLRQAQTPVQFIEANPLSQSGLNLTVVVKGITRLIYNDRGAAYGGGFNQRLVVELQSIED